MAANDGIQCRRGAGGARRPDSEGIPVVSARRYVAARDPSSLYSDRGGTRRGVQVLARGHELYTLDSLLRMNARLVLGGLKSYLPIGRKGYYHPTQTGGYHYSVWMRHLRLATDAGLPTRDVKNIVELGPGDSIALGLSALMSGVESYVGLDVIDHANDAGNLKAFEELVGLFNRRAAPAGDAELPLVYPRLPAYEFPHDILDDSRLARTLSADRIEAIRRAIPTAAKSPMIRYASPWSPSMVAQASTDWVISQGTLQDMDHEFGHDTLSEAFEAMHRWLRPGGFMTHHMDLSAPGGAVWYHLWRMSDLEYRLVRGNRPHYRNRQPLSEYLALCDKHGFDVSAVVPVKGETAVRESLNRRYARVPSQDLETRAVFIAARKR